MGLFSSSKSSTSKTDNIYTTTTSTVGDIGLTGANAVEVIKSMISGVVEQTGIQAEVIKEISQEGGKNYQQLIGGANQLIATTPQLAQPGYSENAYMKTLIPIAVIAGGFFLFARRK